MNLFPLSSCNWNVYDIIYIFIFYITYHTYLVIFILYSSTDLQQKIFPFFSLKPKNLMNNEWKKNKNNNKKKQHKTLWANFRWWECFCNERKQRKELVFKMLIWVLFYKEFNAELTRKIKRNQCYQTHLLHLLEKILKVNGKWTWIYFLVNHN